MKIDTSKFFEGRENAIHFSAVDFSFVGDKLGEWCGFSGPIVERSNSVQKESRISLKTAFNRYVDLLLPTLLRGSSN